MNERSVFISYASQDARPFALELEAALGLGGFRVWMDTFDMRHDRSVEEHLRCALDEASWIALLISPAYADSRWCRLELEGALEREEAGAARILPIALDQAPADAAAWLGEVESSSRPRAVADGALGARSIAQEIQSSASARSDRPESQPARTHRYFTDQECLVHRQNHTPFFEQCVPTVPFDYRQARDEAGTLGRTARHELAGRRARDLGRFLDRVRSFPDVGLITSDRLHKQALLAAGYTVLAFHCSTGRETLRALTAEYADAVRLAASAFERYAAALTRRAEEEGKQAFQAVAVRRPVVWTTLGMALSIAQGEQVTDGSALEAWGDALAVIDREVRLGVLEVIDQLQPKEGADERLERVRVVLVRRQTSHDTIHKATAGVVGEPAWRLARTSADAGGPYTLSRRLPDGLGSAYGAAGSLDQIAARLELLVPGEAIALPGGIHDDEALGRLTAAAERRGIQVGPG